MQRVEGVRKRIVIISEKNHMSSTRWVRPSARGGSARASWSPSGTRSRPGPNPVWGAWWPRVCDTCGRGLCTRPRSLLCPRLNPRRSCWWRLLSPSKKSCGSACSKVQGCCYLPQRNLFLRIGRLSIRWWMIIIETTMRPQRRLLLEFSCFCCLVFWVMLEVVRDWNCFRGCCCCCLRWCWCSILLWMFLRVWCC